MYSMSNFEPINPIEFNGSNMQKKNSSESRERRQNNDFIVYVKRCYPSKLSFIGRGKWKGQLKTGDDFKVGNSKEG